MRKPSTQLRPLHILMIAGIFYPKVDGSVIAVSNVLTCLHDHGHIVHLLTRRLEGTPPIQKWQDISVIRVGPNNPSLISRLILSLNLVRAGSALMKEEKLDVIHVHGFTSLLAGLILKGLFNRPVVVTFHGFPRLWFKDLRWRRDWTFSLMYPFEKFLVNNADLIVAQSQILKNVIIQMYRADPGKVYVMPHVIDEELFRFAPSFPSVKPVVLFVGTLARVHGVDLLIKAAPFVLKAVPQTKFVIVGSGPQRDNLLELIGDLKLEKSVSLVGPVFDKTKLASHYATSSVVVIPLKYAGYILSLVALEAMSTGTPVVTTMTLDPDLEKYGVHRTGFNPVEIAQAIKEILLLSKEEYLTLAASARKYIEEQCSKDKVAEKLENLYMQVIREISHS